VKIEQAQLEEELRWLELSLLDNKYDPNQPRVPAGNSDGGQWTDGGASGIGPMTTSAGVASSSNQSWIGGAERTARQIDREIPLGSFMKHPAIRSAAALFSSLRSPEIEVPLDQAVKEFNAIAATDDRTTIPIISSRARIFTKDETDTKVWASVRKADIEEISKVCPQYFTVQTQTDIAAFAAGPVSNFTDAGAYGTRVHFLLEQQINRAFTPMLKAEYVLWNALADLPGKTYTADATQGKKYTVELDVYEKVSDDLVCVYDIKTGMGNFTTGRMSQLSHAVAKKYPGVKYFFMIEVRPSAGAMIRGDR
jgi:hypothetical protein